jgi:divinyl chlorophyllide a 8-vinyl-reductase
LVDVNIHKILKIKMQALESIKADSGKIEAVISCLASRSGIKKDAYAIDYQATKNCLDAGSAVDARHFVLLSAFCCKNPWLQFQQAKLKMEADLTGQNKMTYSIVRPTAFFKSVSGQLEVIQQGAPFVMFGDGEVTRCNPIAESELAQYLVDSISDKSRENKLLNLGGPDEPLTMKKQGEVSSSRSGPVTDDIRFVSSKHLYLTMHFRCCTKLLERSPISYMLPFGYSM